MQGIGLQRLAMVLPGRAAQARLREKSTAIDSITTRKAQRLTFHCGPLLEDQALDGLVDDPQAGSQEEDGFQQGGEVFGLSPSVGVFLAGRPAGDPHGPERHAGGHEVQAGMGGLGEDAQAVGEDSDDQLQQHQHAGGQQRGEGDPALFAVFLLAVRGMGVGHVRHSLLGVFNL